MTYKARKTATYSSVQKAGGDVKMLPSTLLGSMTSSNTMVFENLTPCHGVKIDSNASVEDYVWL